MLRHAAMTWGHVATAHLRAVFIERHIAHPMRLVLNLPLPAYQGKQALRRGPLGAQAGDPIDHFHPFLARFGEHDVTSQLKDLREPGPITVADEGRTRRDIALLDAPMAEVDVRAMAWRSPTGGSVKTNSISARRLRLVLFDDHDIIPALVDNRLRDVALGQERVHRDKTTFQDQGL